MRRCSTWLSTLCPYRSSASMTPAPSTARRWPTSNARTRWFSAAAASRPTRITPVRACPSSATGRCPRRRLTASAAASTTSADLPAVRREVSDRASHLGLSSGRIADLVAAVNELVSNALLHGGGRGRPAALARCRRRHRDVRCDRTRPHRRPAGRPPSSCPPRPAARTGCGSSTSCAIWLNCVLGPPRPPSGCTCASTAASADRCRTPISHAFATGFGSPARGYLILAISPLKPKRHNDLLDSSRPREEMP